MRELEVSGKLEKLGICRNSDWGWLLVRNRNGKALYHIYAEYLPRHLIGREVELRVEVSKKSFRKVTRIAPSNA